MAAGRARRDPSTTRLILGGIIPRRRRCAINAAQELLSTADKAYSHEVIRQLLIGSGIVAFTKLASG